VRFGFIRTEKANYPVPVLCRVLEVSRSGFYAWLSRPASLRSREDARLRVEIRAEHAASRGTYGSPRIQTELGKSGRRVSRKRVARLMVDERIHGQRKRRFRVTTDSRHSLPIAPNLLKREFTTSKPNEVWVADITYIWTWEGWLYLGWSLDSHIDTDLALGALHAALRTRTPEPGAIFHSDRGIQYAAKPFRDTLTAHGLQASMSRKGDCWDNAVAESFFSTLKAECVPVGGYRSRAEARASAPEYIEVFYNCLRVHTTIGGMSPVTFEACAGLELATA